LEGLSFVRDSRGLVTLVFLATALNFLLMPASTLLSYFVNVDHHGLEADYALVAAVSQLGMLVGGLLMIVRSGFKRKMRATMLFILVCFVGYVLVAFTPLGWFWFMGACFFLMSFAVAPANVLLSTILQTIVPAQMQGRVRSVLMSLSMAASPLGMMMSGVLAAVVGTANLFFATAVAGFFVVVGAWFLTDVRHVEDVKKEESA
jgi:DHA3 family macrolide efflux protein-like MFS transporter